MPDDTKAALDELVSKLKAEPNGGFIEIEGRSTDHVIRQLRGFPEVASLHTTNGGWDLVAELRTSSLGEFDRVLARIRSVEGVVNSETSLLLSSVLR